MSWTKYPDLERHERLRSEGREVLGLEVLITEKRDGENVSIWVNDKDNGHLMGLTNITPTIRISSHNMENAAASIQTKLKATAEWPIISELLMLEHNDWHQDLIVFGELVNAGYGPTRIEPKHKKAQYVIFDIFDCKRKRFLDYDRVFQYAHSWKVPIVKALGSFNPKEIKDLEDEIAKWKIWCKRHKREGVVMKSYTNQVFFKEKIDLPDLKRHKVKRPEGEILPPMPEDRLLRALQHAYDEVGVQWAEPKITMPVIAKHIQAEAREHNFEPPRNFFKIYKETPLDKVRKVPEELQEAYDAARKIELSGVLNSITDRIKGKKVD